MSSRKWYVVTVVETVVHKIPVKAKNEEQADRKAEDLFTNEGGEPFYSHSDWEITRTRKVKLGK
ncbi:DpnD/PcfM family protein [Streptomyces ardesiacus]|uniref:DpnD/PcfM family protein n=1 Tax=Streptomyces ardesiacus TaxID=285564 RepID=UPI00380F2BB9